MFWIAILTLIATVVCAYFGWWAITHARQIDRGSARLEYVGLHVLDEDGVHGNSWFNSVILRNESDHVIRVQSFGYQRAGLLRRTNTLYECPVAIASMEEKQVVVGKPDAIKGFDLGEVQRFFIRTERGRIWLTDKDTRSLLEEWSREPEPYNPIEDERLWTTL